MKFFLTSIFSFLFSALFLLFLLTNENFSPTTTTGGINNVNIFVLIFLLIIATFSLFIILLYLFFKFFKKELTKGERTKQSIKFSSIITAGLLVVFFLHFYQLLDFIWGLIIFVVVLFLIFVV